MFYKNEKQLITIIKYAPIVFIISMGIFVTTFLFYQSNIIFNKEAKSLTQKYLTENKSDIKRQIENVHNYIQNNEVNSERVLKEILLDEVNNAHTIAKSIYEANKHRSKASIEKEIKIALRDVRFNNKRGYFFIYDKKGVNIMHPLLPKVEGKNLRFFNNLKGEAPVDESLKLLKDKDHSFQIWNWQKNKNEPKLYKKLGYVKNFYEMDWFIGTGEYIDEFQKNLKKTTLEYLDTVSFSKNGYIFITDFDGIQLLTKNKDMEGKNARQNPNIVNPKQLLSEIITISKSGGGFIEYTHLKKPNKPNIKVKKISYVKSFDKWGWVIGTGFYEDDLQASIMIKKKEISNNFFEYIVNVIIVILSLVVILLLISLFISKILSKKFQGYREDIQKHIEDNLTQKNKLIQAQNVAHLGTWELDLKTMEAHWSNEILNVFGLYKAPIKEGPELLKTLIIEEDWHYFEESITQTIAQESEHKCIYRIKRKNDGQIRWIDCRGQKLPNGEKIIGTVQDITDRKEIELAYNEKNERLNAIFEYSPLGTVIVSIDGVILEINQTLEDMLGFDKDELIGQTIRDITYDSKEYATSQRYFNKMINGQIDRYQLEKRYMKKDGSFIWAKLTVAPIYNDNKNIRFILGMIEDISDIKNATEKIKQNEEMLHHQSKMAAMGEMLENIAHQWRQPLSVITTGASSIKIQKEMNSLEDEFLFHSVDAITKSAQHLSQTIDDFRDFFKPDKEKVEFSITTVYEKTLSLLSSKFKNREINLIENINDIQISSYDNELIQVLINILNNSKDALENSKESEKYIFVDIFKEEGKAVIKIKDNAGGVEEDIMSKIFEPYFTTKHKSQGTGIGLYMSEEIITKHMNGEISVSNKTYKYNNNNLKGAEFIISLPI